MARRQNARPGRGSPTRRQEPPRREASPNARPVESQPKRQERTEEQKQDRNRRS